MQVLRCAASITVDAKALGLRMMHSITKTPQQYSRMHSSSRGTFGCLRPQRSGLGGIGIAAASRSVVAFSGSGAAAAAAAAAAARRAWGPAARPLLLGAPHNAAATPSFAARGAVVAAFHSLKDEEQQQQQGHHILEQRQRQRRHQAFLVPRAAAAATAAAWADFSTSGPHVNGNSTSNAAGADHAPLTSSAAAAAAAAAADSSSSGSSGFLDTAAAADRAASDAAEELHAVDTAIRANAAIFVAKLAVFFISSSSAMLAEAIHSLVDVANQMLLRVGIRKAEKGPTRQHPYGYARDQFVWPLISAVGIFCCGAGVSFIHGVQSLFAPHEIGPLFWNFVVLGVSLLLEGHSLRVAVDTLRRRAERQGMGLWAYIRAGSDPAATAIMMEDGAAVAGLVIAGTCLGLVQATGMAVWDAAGSLAVAGLLGAVAVTLIQRNREWLIGKSMPPESEALIVEYLRCQAVVRSIDSVRTEEIGLRVYRFQADVAFDGAELARRCLDRVGRRRLFAALADAAKRRDAGQVDALLMQFAAVTVSAVGAEVDRMERDIAALVPGTRYVDLEADRGRPASAPSGAGAAAAPGGLPQHRMRGGAAGAAAEAALAEVAAAAAAAAAGDPGAQGDHLSDLVNYPLGSLSSFEASASASRDESDWAWADDAAAARRRRLEREAVEEEGGGGSSSSSGSVNDEACATTTVK